ncbi:MAG: hypothetical protein IPL39_08175 [Opitutaceae bacterium]|nr:hypothetical protein [Opitutaceae bacterium]
MSDWLLVVVVFWGAYLLDGLRRGRRARPALVRAFPGPQVVRQERLHFLAPLPWATRFWADDPPFVFSPGDLQSAHRRGGPAGGTGDFHGGVALGRN